LRVEGSGFRVQGWGFRVESLGCSVEGSGFRVQGWRFRVENFGVQGLGCRAARGRRRRGHAMFCKTRREVSKAKRETDCRVETLKHQKRRKRFRGMDQVVPKGRGVVHHFTEMCRGSKAGSYLRLIDSCITQLRAQGPSRTCNESNDEEEEGGSLAFERSSVGTVRGVLRCGWCYIRAFEAQRIVPYEALHVFVITRGPSCPRALNLIQGNLQ